MPYRLHISLLARVTFIVTAFMTPLPVYAQAPVAIPNSPAGILLKQWLDLLNRADGAGLDTFWKVHKPSVSTQVQLQKAAAMGGLEPVRLLLAEPSHIILGGVGKVSREGVRVTIKLMDGNPVQIDQFSTVLLPPGVPLEGCTTFAAAKTHGLSSADVISEDAIVAALYDGIAVPPCQRIDWDRWGGLFAPGARLISKGTAGVTVWTPEEYATTTGANMEGNGHFEDEISHVSESFNGIVHRFSTYANRSAAGAAPFSRGINSIQLLNDGKRWWIVTVYWAAERPDAPIPEIYLKRP